MSHPLRFLLLVLPVLLLALLTVWLPRVGDSARDPLVEQASEAVEAAPLTPEQRELDQAVSRIGGTFDGHVGIAVRDIEGGRTLHFNGLELFPQQSVSKLWVAMTALDEVDAGRLDLSEMVAIRSADLTVFHQPIRDIVRRDGSFSSDYAELIERAITESDNTANDRLLRRVGGAEAVQDFLDTHGLASIRFGTDERSKQSAIAGLEWRQSYAQGPAFFDARDRVDEAARREAFESYLADPIDGAPRLRWSRRLRGCSAVNCCQRDRPACCWARWREPRAGRKAQGGRAGGLDRTPQDGHRAVFRRRTIGLQRHRPVHRAERAQLCDSGDDRTDPRTYSGADGYDAAGGTCGGALRGDALPYPHHGRMQRSTDCRGRVSAPISSRPCQRVQRPMAMPAWARVSPTHWLQVLASV